MSKMAGNLGMKRYWAFISYSHADTKVAGWLHKALEGFKIPTPLIGTESRNGVVPKRIFPVFRDRDELPTSADLGANLHAALRNSRYLIVLCSPKSATSMWVNAEVEFFKKTHGNANVLCLIVGGAPGGTGVGEKAECFCPALQHHINPDGSAGELSEPIAADLRDTKDGRLRAFLKIVAGIIGVDFDALYQREKRRKRKRALALAAAAGILTGIGVIFYQRLDSVAKSQSEMASEVKKMREMKFREFGELPEVRAQELQSLIFSSGILQSEESLVVAMNYEKDRFRRFQSQTEKYADARSRLFSEFENFLERVRPASGWPAAAQTLSRFAYFFAMDEKQGMELMDNQYRVSREMKRTTEQLSSSLAGITSGLSQATAGVHQVIAATKQSQREMTDGAGDPSDDGATSVGGDGAGEPQPDAASAAADNQVYGEEFAISAAFGNHLDQASRLAAQMRQLEETLPASWIVGTTEPKIDTYYGKSRARSLTHAAWLLATSSSDTARNPQMALELAEKASALQTSQSGPTLEALAAASASTGDFDSALKWQSMAVRPGAEASPQEQEEMLERYKRYESNTPFLREVPDGTTVDEILLCIANQDGFESWVIAQRERLGNLALMLEEFAKSPEEKVVVQDEFERLRNRQIELEIDGESRLNALRRQFVAALKAAQEMPSGAGYSPVTQMDGRATVSEKIWYKPAGAPERGSLKTVAAHPSWPGAKPRVDREGSVELYCIQRFVFPSSDGGSLDLEKMGIARNFASSAAGFLGIYLP